MERHAIQQPMPAAFIVTEQKVIDLALKILKAHAIAVAPVAALPFRQSNPSWYFRAPAAVAFGIVKIAL